MKELLTILYSGFTAYWAVLHPNFSQKRENVAQHDLCMVLHSPDLGLKHSRRCVILLQADYSSVISCLLRVHTSHFWLLHKRFKLSESGHLSAASMFVCQTSGKLSVCLSLYHCVIPYVFLLSYPYTGLNVTETETNNSWSILTLHNHIKAIPRAIGLGIMNMSACLSV